MSGWLEQYTQPGSAPHLAALLDEAPVGVLGTDSQGKVTYANAQAARLLGREPSALGGHSAETLLRLAPGSAPALGAPEREYRLESGGVLGLRRVASPGGETWLLRDLSDFAFLREGLMIAEYREQRRLAQVLHDQLSQQLLGAAFTAKMLAMQLERQNPPPSVEEANDLARLINECAAQLREVTADPAIRAAAEGDFPRALREMARMQRRAPVEIVIPDESLIDLGRNTSIIFNLCREAVNSAVAAGAPQVTVMARSRGDEITVKIVSDEASSNELTVTPATPARRLFEFRCQAVGAETHIHAGAGAGSTLTLRLPTQS
jgi:signal transduction histidine kinase